MRNITLKQCKGKKYNSNNNTIVIIIFVMQLKKDE